MRERGQTQRHNVLARRQAATFRWSVSSPTEAIILRKPPRRLDLNGLLMEGPRVFRGDLRHFGHFSQNPRISATTRRSPTLEVCRYHGSKCAQKQQKPQRFG